jgi:hypothetical protein
MTVQTVTCYFSDLDPSRTPFLNYNDCREYEQKKVPRQAVAEILRHEGNVNYDDDDVIDKIVAKLGELWSVRGFEKVEAAAR